jgi:hypothetical protein
MSITIAFDEILAQALQTLAEKEQTSVPELVQRVVAAYASVRTPTYSFIGIGHSGKRDLSVRAEEILDQSANRREGWSLP